MPKLQEAQDGCDLNIQKKALIPPRGVAMERAAYYYSVQIPNSFQVHNILLN